MTLALTALATSAAAVTLAARRSGKAWPALVVAAVLLAGATAGVEREAPALHPSAEMGAGYRVAAGGWPLVWAVDDPAASTVGVVDLADLFVGPDHVLAGPFAAGAALAVLLGLARAVRVVRQRGAAPARPS